MIEARGSAEVRDDAERTRRTPGTPCWVSLMVHNPHAIQEFYEALFGWEFESGPEGFTPYARATLNGQPVAGIGRLPEGHQLPVTWTPYLATDDVDATAETVRHCGGTVGVGPLDAGGDLRLAIASDPVGAVFGLWQSPDPRNETLTGVPGASSWNELVTRETEGVAAFYHRLFGYEQKTGAAVGLDYATLFLDGRPVASLHGVGRDLPRDRGAHWLTYFQVDDVDRAIEGVPELGGTVVKPPRDEYYGRTATLTDPEGALFAVIRPSR